MPRFETPHFQTRTRVTVSSGLELLSTSSDRPCDNSNDDDYDGFRCLSTTRLHCSIYENDDPRLKENWLWRITKPSLLHNNNVADSWNLFVKLRNEYAETLHFCKIGQYMWAENCNIFLQGLTIINNYY